MLSRLRKSLLVSAAARNLAVDLVREHRAGALDIVDQALAIVDKEQADGEHASDNQRILSAARDHIVALVERLPDEPRRGETGGADGLSGRATRSR